MIFVPFTYIHQPTWDALEGHRTTPWQVDDASGYLRYWRVRWREGREFVNVEHDVVVQPGQLEQFDQCPEEWCSFPEAGMDHPTMALVRFRAPFIAANREVWGKDWVMPAGQGKSWTWLDSHLQLHADRKACLHDPPVLNERPHGPSH